MNRPPLQFIFGLHVHQPVGNFDHVFADHVEDVYLPFLSALAEREFFPVSLHVSGPLLDWLEAHDARYLDLIGRLVTDGKLELLLSGYYEPILAALPRPDRVEQIQWMRDALARRFGVDARTLWLTERVWEPDLAADLADAGVGCALVDDRHFLVSGFAPHDLHGPYRTEHDGKAVSLLAIDEQLRYLIPFHPPEETASYLRTLGTRGHRLAIVADDGEKFGGWPGTKEWVYDRGWLASFLDTLDGMVAGGELELTTPERAVREIPSLGLAYLPTASYREMEAWALHPEANRRLEQLDALLVHEHVQRTDRALLRGAHWRNFLVKYPEANRMHKKMVHLSDLCRRRGNPDAARRAIGRAQCNDAYWHGVFGGLYLPHLRAAIWSQLAAAEHLLRADEPLTYERVDIDGDGLDELWIHSPHFSAIVSPARGGAVEEYSIFAHGTNYADVLTRRREAYHQIHGDPADHEDAHDGTPSIHELEPGLRLGALPPVDHHVRSLLDERVLDADVDEPRYHAAEYRPIATWATAPVDLEIVTDDAAIVVRMHPHGSDRLNMKELTFRADGTLAVRYRWAPEAFTTAAWFAPEISTATEVRLRGDPEPTALWRAPIATVAKSERGLEETTQGHSATPVWPIALGEAVLTIAVVEDRAAAAS